MSQHMCNRRLQRGRQGSVIGRVLLLLQLCSAEILVDRAQHLLQYADDLARLASVRSPGSLGGQQLLNATVLLC